LARRGFAGSGRSFSVELTPGSLGRDPATSKRLFDEKNAVFMLPDWGLFGWRWPLDTTIEEAFEDIANLLKKPRDELAFQYDPTPGVELVRQLTASGLIPLEVSACGPVPKATYEITVSYRGKAYPVHDLEAASYVIQLKVTAWEVIKADLEFVWRDLILAERPDGGDPVDDGLTLEELGQDQLFGTFPTSVTIKFRSGEQKWQQTFGPIATVLEARTFASEKTGCQDLSNIQLFYAGRALRDEQMLSRLRMRPGNFITIVADMDKTLLVQSVRCLNLAPIQYKFHRTDTQEEFTLVLLRADMADRARIMVAAHCRVTSDAVSL
jgi:hypothetical protein